MAEQVLASSTSARLEPFVLLAKSAKGAACVQLVQDATAAPGVYVFSELLETPSVRELSNTHQPYFRLLEIFAYGTFADYKENSANLPPLSDVQTRKLKHLTIVTLSGKHRTLHYDMLQQQLDISSVRDLEDLVIDAIYQDLVRGKLDQRRMCLEVEYAMGRDIRPEEETDVLAVLAAWSRTSENILQSIEANITNIGELTALEAMEKEAHEKRLEAVKKHVDKSSGAGGAAGEGRHGRGHIGAPSLGDYGELGPESSRRRTGKSRHGGAPSRH
ncbi:COP9 signalosome complex subunit 7a [Thoreauomyces humboldtii]|nr:COP9 signalosome complex subunit 7a [Thoreauomyces humboldtii]